MECLRDHVHNFVGTDLLVIGVKALPIGPEFQATLPKLLVDPETYTPQEGTRVTQDFPPHQVGLFFSDYMRVNSNLSILSFKSSSSSSSSGLLGLLGLTTTT